MSSLREAGGVSARMSGRGSGEQRQLVSGSPRRGSRVRPAVAAVVAALSAGLLGLSQDLDSTPYLAGDRAPDTAAILPSAPLPGSVRAQADQAIFRQTRALEGSPRWTLAQNDVAEAVPAVLADFSCASQAKLGEVDAPKLAHILRRLRFDVVTAVNHPKALYDRKRPYLQDAGDICVAKSPDLAASPDYPSGHATWGWAVGTHPGRTGARPRHGDPWPRPRLWRKPGRVRRSQRQRRRSGPHQRRGAGRRPAWRCGFPRRHGRRARRNGRPAGKEPTTEDRGVRRGSRPYREGAVVAAKRARRTTSGRSIGRKWLVPAMVSIRIRPAAVSAASRSPRRRVVSRSAR